MTKIQEFFNQDIIKNSKFDSIEYSSENNAIVTLNNIKLSVYVADWWSVGTFEICLYCDKLSKILDCPPIVNYNILEFNDKDDIFLYIVNNAANNLLGQKRRELTSKLIEIDKYLFS